MGVLFRFHGDALDGGSNGDHHGVAECGFGDGAVREVQDEARTSGQVHSGDGGGGLGNGGTPEMRAVFSICSEGMRKFKKNERRKYEQILKIRSESGFIVFYFV